MSKHSKKPWQVNDVEVCDAAGNTVAVCTGTQRARINAEHIVACVNNADADALAAENTRLREALEKITQTCEDFVERHMRTCEGAQCNVIGIDLLRWATRDARTEVK